MRGFVTVTITTTVRGFTAATERILLSTGVTVLSLLDPVRVAEDYATLDQLSGGRLELMIGKGNDVRDYSLFGLKDNQKWEYQEEKFVLLRRLLLEKEVTWSGEFRPPLDAVTTLPRPFGTKTRIWHGSSSSTESTELAARFGDPLFTANLFQPNYRTPLDTTRDDYQLVRKSFDKVKLYARLNMNAQEADNIEHTLERLDVLYGINPVKEAAP